MATSVVTYNPAAGRAFIDLTGWTGSIGATTTPVATDQIEGPDTLTLNAGSPPTGADGTYTLRHLQAANGTTEAVSFTITTADTTEPTLTSPSATVTGSTTLDASVSTDEANGTLYTLASANATETKATVKSSGQSQAVSATGNQNASIAGLTASTPYYVHFMHEDAATNQSTVATSAQVTTDAAPASSGATTTVAYDAPTGKTDVTLATGFDGYIFQEWATQPVVGEQIVFTDSEITVDELANVTASTEAVFDIWFVQLDGTVTATTIDTTGLASAGPDTTPDAFTVAALTNQPLNQYVEFAPITVAGIDSGESIAVTVTGAGVQYAVDAGSGYGGYTATSTNVQLGDLVRPRILTSATAGATVTGSIAIGSQSSSLSATTEVLNVPTLTLTGGTVSLAVDGTFTEPGFSASDEIDGDLTGAVSVAGSVDTSKDSTNLLVYTVTNSSGNTASATRIVVVGTGGAIGIDRSIIARSIRSDRAARSETVDQPIASNI